MSTFADSSALVKLYVPEQGSQHVRSLDVLVASQLASVEVPAAIWRKQRMGELSATDARLLVAAFEADYHGTQVSPPRFAAVAVTQVILDVAARLTGVHGLRAYEAVQLATARLVMSADPECTTFAAFDKDLCTAAAAEGFLLAPS
ncbi:MAG: VapC toxin family PIN domain ribonuclease [Pseudonocardiaceae bacterium]|nr:VapC toxin family PIN domain ribonuclease [Pseudonocardiaceae bacterium]